ncbi:murein L,D-transpeptidase family protein [Thalassotalea maritima]|uniref:L,D-transpeptidase family protein n=1 Tax=Thalassotalea maritima TaxID=3242416 RepID=UPI003527086E
MSSRSFSVVARLVFVVTLTLSLASVAPDALAKTAYLKVDLVKVDKSSRTMYLLKGDKVVKKYHIALGRNTRGHKVREGDRRTPEGEYVLDYVKEDSAFHRAMHISYPNAEDIARAKTKGVSPGGFIMIHGQKNGDKRDPRRRQRLNWTNGCIALTNAEMDEFLSLVETGTKIRIQW